jgi:hypothetical protein
MWATKFHTHTKQQACISEFLYFWTANWKTKDSAPNDNKHSPYTSKINESLLRKINAEYIGSLRGCCRCNMESKRVMLTIIEAFTLSLSLSFFLSFLVWPLLPIHCECWEVIVAPDYTQWHAHAHTRTRARARAHTHTHTHTRAHTHTVELLWTSDQPDAEASTWQHKHSQEKLHVHGSVHHQW